MDRVRIFFRRALVLADEGLRRCLDPSGKDCKILFFCDRIWRYIWKPPTNYLLHQYYGSPATSAFARHCNHMLPSQGSFRLIVAQFLHLPGGVPEPESQNEREGDPHAESPRNQTSLGTLAAGPRSDRHGVSVSEAGGAAQLTLIPSRLSQ